MVMVRTRDRVMVMVRIKASIKVLSSVRVMVFVMRWCLL
jgi:hypothetical protein